MQAVLDDLDAVIDELERELGSLGDGALDAAPPEGGWSARQTIGHLTLTARLYDERLQARIARSPGGCAPTTKPHKPNWFAGMLLKFLPNLGKRFKAPKVFDPARSSERFTPEGLVSTYRRLRATAGQVHALHMGACCIGTPVSRLLRMKMRDAFDIQVLHARRHLVQIRRAAGLPAAGGTTA